MSVGYRLITRWFAQRMEENLTQTGRRFDKELNKDLLAELVKRQDDLALAVETGVNVTETAAQVGIAAMAVAYNVEKGLGEPAEQDDPFESMDDESAVAEPQPPQDEALAEDLAPAPRKKIILPKKKTGAKRKIGV